MSQTYKDYLNHPEIELKVETDTVISIKSVGQGQERREALFVVLEPTDPLHRDLHDDFYDETTIADACVSFNTECGRLNIQHEEMTDVPVLLESYVAPAEMLVEGETIQKGTWLQKWYFPEGDEGERLYQLAKSGECGLSIHAQALRTYYTLTTDE